MADNLRSKILEADDLSSEVLVIPEWGDAKIEVRSMTGRDRAGLQKHFKGDTFDMETWYVELVLATVYDPDTGKRVFDPADRKEIGGKSARALERIAEVATRLSGMTAQAVAEAKDDIKSE